MFQRQPDVGDDNGRNVKNDHDGGVGKVGGDRDGGDRRKKKKGKKKRRRCDDDHFDQRFDLVLGNVNVNVTGCRGKDKHARGSNPACTPAAEHAPSR